MSSDRDARWELLQSLAAAYLGGVLEGDSRRASEAIGVGIERGFEASALLLEVLMPAQREIGSRWHAGELSVCQEHGATELTREQIERVREARRPERRHGARALVCAAPGEPHTLPAHVVAALLDCAGWEVEFLGQAPSSEAIVEHVARRPPHIVALSVTLNDNLDEATRLCRALRRLSPAPRILIGGAGTAGRSAEDLAADWVVGSATAGLELAARHRQPAAPPALDAYLSTIGRRIRDRRRTVGLSQAGLAERAGLTRPYLGAVERGRQNITLDAGLRIAGALDIQISELLSQ